MAMMQLLANEHGKGRSQKANTKDRPVAAKQTAKRSAGQAYRKNYEPAIVIARKLVDTPQLFPQFKAVKLAIRCLITQVADFRDKLHIDPPQRSAANFGTKLIVVDGAGDNR